MQMLFGYSLFDYSKYWDTDTLFYETPYSIKKVSGDNQTGQANQFLPQPIKIQVLDKLNNPQSSVPVYFTITAGGGSVQNAKILSDSDGYAQTIWKTGSQPGIQNLNVNVKKANGSLIQNTPLSFSATVQNDSIFIDPRDSQLYKIKKIGTQVWMTQNLYYAAQGPLCYDNNDINCSLYGRLYDWNTALTVAPPGWHLPSDAEWKTLITFLGGEDEAGGAMKSTTGWNLPNTGANNSSGFAGLPGGVHGGPLSPFGFSLFYGIREFSQWWSASHYEIPGISHAYIRQLTSDRSDAYRTDESTSQKLSVRCIRNQ